MTISKRFVRLGLPVLILAAGCKDNEEMTEASGTEAASSGTEAATTVTSTAADSETDPGTGSGGTGSGSMGSGTGSTDEPTTGAGSGEPVPCDSPEGCTGMGGGDIASTTLPFFRGEVCVSDKVRPGDPLAISVSTCVHPCLKVTGYAFKWVYRCAEQGCETGLVFYHPDVTGTACPDDVFGAFDPALCKYTMPVGISIQPPETMGDGSLLLPFLSNDDVAAIDGGETENAQVWARVDAHMQAPDRRLPVNFAAENAAPPAACAEGTPGCTCSSIGLP